MYGFFSIRVKCKNCRYDFILDAPMYLVLILTGISLIPLTWIFIRKKIFGEIFSLITLLILLFALPIIYIIVYIYMQWMKKNYVIEY